MDIRLLIFDLDGTLVDSKEDLILSVNATRAHLGLPPLDGETVSSYVGNGAPVLIQRALGPGFSEKQLSDALQFFLSYYREHKLDHTDFYPGVREALGMFGKRTLAVLTNKPVRISREMLGQLGVAARFRYVFGGNSFENKKPHPEGVFAILAESGIAPEQAMMVGDSDVDVIAGRNAGIHTCGVSYGFKPHTFEHAPPDFLVHSLPELARLLNHQDTKTPS